MLIRIKIPGLTNVSSLKSYTGADDNGYIIRNTGNKLEYDIVRMFIFDLARKLESSAPHINFRLANSPMFPKQKAAFFVWLRDNWQRMVKVEQIDKKNIEQKLDELIKIQSDDPIVKDKKEGAYFKGLANGMILSKSVINGKDPKFLDEKIDRIFDVKKQDIKVI